MTKISVYYSGSLIKVEKNEYKKSLRVYQKRVLRRPELRSGHKNNGIGVPLSKNGIGVPLSNIGIGVPLSNNGIGFR